MFLNIWVICPIDWPPTKKQKNVEIIYDEVKRPGLSIIIYFPIKKPNEYIPIKIKFIKPEDIDE
jgi:hypothetical protein